MDPVRALAKANAVIAGYSDVFGQPITRGELLFLLCVGEHETHCGDDWRDNQGNPLHNWGAVQWRKPTADEMTRINAGDLKPGDTIPGGVLHTDSGPAQGKYYVWFRTFPSDRQGAAFLVGVLYKHNPESRATAQIDGTSTDFCTGMYRFGYFEGFRPTPAQRAAGMALPRPVYGPGGKMMRERPLTDSEAANVGDYAGAIDKLMPAWIAALATLPLVAAGDPLTPITTPPPPPGHEAGEA